VKSTSKLKIYIPALVAVLLWSTSFAGVKIALLYLSPLLFAGIRFSLSGIMVLFYYLISIKFSFSRLREEFPSIKTVIIIALLQTFIMYAFYFIGLDMVSGAVGAVIMGSSPLFAVLVSHLLVGDDRLTIRKVISISLGISGIVLISINKQFSADGELLQLLGVFFLIIAMIISALSNVYIKKHPVRSPLFLNGLQLFIGGILLIPFSFLFDINPFRSQETIPLEFYVALVWLSLVSAIAFSIWYSLLKKDSVKVSELNMWKFLIPAVGAALVWLIVPGESFDWVTFAGMGIVSFSILFFFI